MGTGIDYGLGMTNIDHETGIRYGVINVREVLQAWCDDSVPVYPCKGCPEHDTEKDECMNSDACEACYFEYDEDGFRAEQQANDTDIFITKSKYYTLCGYCSPCAPGAGYLMSNGEVKAYCFGHDWFEEVETGKWVECAHCKGTGLRNKSDLYTPYEKNPEAYIEYDDKRVKCWVCADNEKFGYMGHVKEYIRRAPYKVYSVETGEEVMPESK